MNTHHKWQQLTRDTITYLKAEGLIEKKPAKILAPKPPAPPPPQKMAQKKVIQKEAPVASTSISTQLVKPKASPKQTPPIFDKIKKHLPHIQLIESIPQMREVALVITNPEDRPFLENLKKAIEDRFCPVSWIEGTKDKDWSTFVLVITQTPLNLDHEIVLEIITTYQNQTEHKKKLWLEICQKLSLKSS